MEYRDKTKINFRFPRRMTNNLLALLSVFRAHAEHFSVHTPNNRRASISKALHNLGCFSRQKNKSYGNLVSIACLVLSESSLFTVGLG